MNSSGIFQNLDLSTPNSIEVAVRDRRAKGLPLLDLTSTNPTKEGIIFPADILEELSAPFWKTRCYEPSAKGLLQAREAIAAYYSKRTPAWQENPDHIFITSSTSEAYILLFSILCGPGDVVLVPKIGYPLFEYLAAVREVKLRPYKNAYKNDGTDWEIEEIDLDSLGPKVKGLILISPHNPTGKIQDRANAAIAGSGLPLICDEVFSEFAVAKKSVPPLSFLYPEQPVFLLNGISKMFSLPDLKLGWIALNDLAYSAYGARLEFLNDLLLGANSLSQYILPGLFERGFAFVRETREQLCLQLKEAVNILAASKRLRITLPDGAYFLFPEVTEPDADEDRLVLSLIEQGVLVHPGYFYGCDAGAHLMISGLVERTKLLEGVRKIAAFMKKL